MTKSPRTTRHLFWFVSALASLPAQEAADDLLERARSAQEGAAPPFTDRFTELCALLALDRWDEVPLAARVCAAGLAPGRLAPALLALAEGRVGVETVLGAVGALRRRGRVDLTLPLLLGVRHDAPFDPRMLVALAEALGASTVLRDPELARSSLELAREGLPGPSAERAAAFLAEAGQPSGLATLEARIAQRLAGVARTAPASSGPPRPDSELLAGLVHARERGDQATLVATARRLDAALGGHPALAFVLGAALVSAGPATDREAGRASLQTFLAETDFAAFAAQGLACELDPAGVATLLREVAGKSLAAARAEARTTLATLAGPRAREPLFLCPDRAALPPNIAECDRRIAEFTGLTKERSEHQKELARWRKALAKDLAARGIGGQSADTIRDHIHVHVTAIERIDKRLASEAADPQLPRLRALRARLAAILVRYDAAR